MRRCVVGQGVMVAPDKQAARPEPPATLTTRFMGALAKLIDTDPAISDLTCRQLAHLLRRIADVYSPAGAIERKLRASCWHCGKGPSAPQEAVSERCECGAPGPFWD